jgi:cation diffusion facilitator family transporter
MAGQKPDSDHPFGHGRIEYISGLLVSILIVLMGFELVKSSVSKIFHPEAPDYSPVIIGILVFSIVVKCYMSLYNRRIGTRISSVAMKATAIDSLSDMVATTVVLIGTIVSAASGIIIDGYCGVLVGMFILYSGFVAAKDTISPLLGQPPEPELAQQINDIVLSYDNVIGIHDLIVHNYGPGRTLISLHAEVPADGNIITLHDTIDTIEHELRRKLNCNAVIHMDPVSTSDPETLSLKAEVSGYLDQIDPKLSMHDFRIVKGPTHTNVIFDIVIPYDYPVSDQEVMDSITKRIQTSHPDFFTVIEVDKAVVQ